MPIPDYQGWMLPLLRFIADGQEYALRNIADQLADQLGLTLAEREELLPSATECVYVNRLKWAKTYLKKAGLIHQPSRGKIQITDEGRKLLERQPAKLDNEDLKRYPTFLTFIHQTQPAEIVEQSPERSSVSGNSILQTPEEALEQAYQTLRKSLADELLERLKTCSPAFFEKMVVELLVAMGYGGSLADAGQAIGRSGDDGIDGIIKEDKLGLDVVCVQAKRWQSTVGRPLVQAFAGSMEGQRARKGVMITTATFSRDAHEYIQRIERKIVLIDGQRLTELMIDHQIGVSVARTYAVKKVDDDYFADE